MTILSWITGILMVLYLLIVIANKRNPSQSGDDYMGAAMQTIFGLITLVFAVITFFVWI